MVLVQGLFWGCSQDIGRDCSDQEAWLGLKNLLSRLFIDWLNVSLGWCQVASVPLVHIMGLLECPRNMAVGFPQCEWSKNVRQSLNSICDLALEVSHHFGIILFAMQVSTVWCGRRLHQDGNTRILTTPLSFCIHKHKVNFPLWYNRVDSVSAVSGTWIQSLSWHSSLRIWRWQQLLRRLQLWLGFNPRPSLPICSRPASFVNFHIS